MKVNWLSKQSNRPAGSLVVYLISKDAAKELLHSQVINIRGQATFFELLNHPDQSTFSRKGTTSLSVIDLVFISPRLRQKHIEWEIDHDTASGSDHEILLYSIVESNNLVQNPIYDMPYNLEKADWKVFSQKLLELDQSNEFKWGYIESDADLDYIGLEQEALNLQNIIKIAADSAIPTKRPISRSKAWWSDKLTRLRKLFGKARKL